MTCSRFKTTWFLALALTFVISARSWAVAVYYTTSNLGGGLFQYDLTVDNTGGTEPIIGLTIVKGNSVFGLDSTSTIGAPQDIGGDTSADWAYFAPGPPPDSLDYFSPNSAADVPINGTLGGFFFVSSKNPSTLTGNDFEFDLIGGTSGGSIFGGGGGGIVQPLPSSSVPEPETYLLIGIGVVVMLSYIWRRRQRAA